MIENEMVGSSVPERGDSRHKNHRLSHDLGGLTLTTDLGVQQFALGTDGAAWAQHAQCLQEEAAAAKP